MSDKQPQCAAVTKVISAEVSCATAMPEIRPGNFVAATVQIEDAGSYLLVLCPTEDRITVEAACGCKASVSLSTLLSLAHQKIRTYGHLPHLPDGPNGPVH